MKCTNCGSEIAPNQAFCSTCGTPVPKQQPAQSGAVNQNLGGQAEFNPPPKKRVGASIVVILITLLLIAAIIIGAVLLINNIREDDDDSSSSSSSRKKNDTDDDDDDDDDDNDIVNNMMNNNITNNTISNNPSGNTSGYTVNVGSFTVKVPTNYTYKTSSDTLSVSDEADTLLIRMQIKEAPYSTIVSQKDELGSRMRSSGATINKMEEKTINGTQCLVYEITESGESYIIALIRINSMYTALCEVVRDDYTTYDYEGLKSAISIALTAEKNTNTTTTTTDNSSNTANTSNIESKSKLDLNTIVE